MQWQKSRIWIWTAQDSDFKVTESTEAPGRPYRLESAAHLDDEPVYFASLRAAQAHAATLAELAQLRAENARLRASIMSPAPSVATIAAELVETMARNGNPPAAAPVLSPAQRASATRRSRRAVAERDPVPEDFGPDDADWNAPGQEVSGFVAAGPLDQPF